MLKTRLLKSLALASLFLAASAAGASDGGRLSARPVAPAGAATPDRGFVRLPDVPRQARIYVPDSYRPGTAAPLLLLLHGAGGNAGQDIRTFTAAAEAYGMIVVAPQSSAKTWDIVANPKRTPDGGRVPGDFGADARRIDTILSAVFARYNIDPARTAVAGFSDGASYALALGVANRELFPSIIAFSPGFGPSKRRVGPQRAFVSHGTKDAVLPFAGAEQIVVPSLRALKLDVTFRTFDGGHGVPPEVVRDALTWFLGSGPAGGATRAE